MNNKWKIYMLTIICFIVGTTQFSIVGMLDKIAASVGVSVSTAGQLVTVYALSNAIGTPLVVMAISKMNQRKQLLVALTIILVGIGCMLIFSGFGFLMIARGILGVGSGVFVVNAYGLAAKLADSGRQGSAMSNVAMGFSSSLVFGVPLGRIVADRYEWETIFWIIEILCLISLMAIRKVIPPFEAEKSVSIRKRFSLLKNPKIALMLTVTMFVFIGFSIIDTYITPFLLAAMPMMEDKISMILMILGIGSLIGSKVGGILADRIGITRTITGAVIIQGVSLLLASILGSTWDIGIIILLMIWEVTCWTFGPTQNFNMVSLAPEVSSIALSLNSTFVQIGFSLGAGIGGLVVGGWSIMGITWISAASAIIAILVFGLANLVSTSKEEKELEIL
jgi:DHA1 family putative efflux transporter-like MFS transporter